MEFEKEAEPWGKCSLATYYSQARFGGAAEQAPGGRLQPKNASWPISFNLSFLYYFIILIIVIIQEWLSFFGGIDVGTLVTTLQIRIQLYIYARGYQFLPN
ncbi:hypothetical protein O6H91_16G076600 [Diphasiastrum complanatum]|uniref:Uncharacterized protein n=1 Tax=Diphasiastrum complanatum TaxID=34168 RepID=A0ACC2BDY6_DIPCM|nr:hypothetical protein O6H91_16G076600 [Diphasiastrum complanatum]